jgi:hypothetical protein
MFPITGENCEGLRVDRGNETDLLMFRSRAQTGIMRHAGWSADASVLVVTNQSSNVKTLGSQNSRSVLNGNQLMFSADAPANIAASFGPDKIEAVLSSKTGTGMVLFVGIKPVRVLLDGKEIAARTFRFDRAAGTVALNIPAGRHEVRMVLK